MTEKKRYTAAAAAAVTAAAVTAAVMSAPLIRSRARVRELETALGNSYERAFFQLTDHVNSIDSLLSKAQMAASPAQMASVSGEIFMEAAEAKSCFGELPSGDETLEKTALFLSQVGDYTYVLSQSMINGSGISDKEYSELSGLNDYAGELGTSLSDIRRRITNGELSFEKADGGSAHAAGDIFTDLANVEKAFDDYPSLIYDGPFSEHIENIESPMLKNAPELSREEALIKAREFLGGDGEGLEYETETVNTAAESYVFGDTEDGIHRSISITKKGGYVLYFIENREVRSANYNAEAAAGIAKEFLDSHGFTGMEESYYDTEGNTATVNFAYSQDGTKCYSDLIKVRVALDTGEITGLECSGYIMNHRERSVVPAITEEEAKAYVSPKLSIDLAGTAVIPKDSLREVLCYEFRGTYVGKNFIVYINAENGREEEILLLIETETGVLTV